MTPTPSIARLVVEAGFAAGGYGLRAEMHDILLALPDWVEDPQQLARCEATLLFCLGRRRAAAERLALLSADDCVVLRTLLNRGKSEIRA